MSHNSGWVSGQRLAGFGCKPRTLSKRGGGENLFYDRMRGVEGLWGGRCGALCRPVSRRSWHRKWRAKASNEAKASVSLPCVRQSATHFLCQLRAGRCAPHGGFDAAAPAMREPAPYHSALGGSPHRSLALQPEPMRDPAPFRLLTPHQRRFTALWRVIRRKNRCRTRARRRCAVMGALVFQGNEDTKNPTFYKKGRVFVWAYLGLNQGPLPCEGNALPLSYMPAPLNGRRI